MTLNMHPSIRKEHTSEHLQSCSFSLHKILLILMLRSVKKKEMRIPFVVFGLALLALESETYSLILIKKIFYANPPAPSTSFVAKGRHLHFKCSSKRPGLKMNEIPPEWKEVMDPQTGKPYWYNPTTLQTSWEPPVPATIDPKKVAPFSAEAAASTFEMMGKFTEKLSEYKACADPVQKRALRLEILSIYTEFAVPALSLAVGTFITFPGAFVFFFIALQASGRGLADIQTLAAPVPFAADALSHVDPALGNAAIAAVVMELASPLLILGAVAIKGTVEARLREGLPRWGLDADGLARRLDALAGGEDADLL